MAKVNYKIKKGIQIMIKEGPISLTKKIHCSIKKNNISIIKPPYEMLSNIQFKKGYIDIEIKYKDNSKEIESRKLIPKMDSPSLTKVKYPPQQNFNTPIEEKFKDNKYNNKIYNKYNNDTQNFKKTKANFEEREYEGFNFDTLYANYSMMKGTS